MSSRNQSSNEQEQVSRGDEAPKRTGRLRSSCDSCHRSKIKCTGSNPCSACQSSQSACTYSRGGRLGRPKGSKNKRTSIQEGSAGRVDEQSDTTGVSADVTQWGAVDLTSFGSGLDHDFGSVFSDFYVDGPLLFDSNEGALGPLSPRDRLDLQALLTQNAGAFDLPNSAGNEGASGSDTTTTPPRYATLPRPDEPLFGNDKPMNPAASISSGPPDCACLQQLVKLVYQLENLRCPHSSGPAIDAVLEGVRLAEGPWGALMQCNHCQNKDTYKEKLSGCLFQVEVTLGIPISIGAFSLSDDAKLEVIDVAIRKALRAIAVALVHLWERTGKPRLNYAADQDMDNNALLSPVSLFSGMSDAAQTPLACYDLASALSGTKNTMPLLGLLQSLMKVTEEELKTGMH